ncbi:MAG: TolC family protein [Planctomycetes bacterium]|nr:TolC family protein [Planctomycetota bacterium]
MNSVSAKLGWLTFTARAAVLAPAFGLAGCVLAPGGLGDEEAKSAAAGEAWGVPEADRPPAPDLPPEADWRAVLRRAFLTNGDLEAAYHRWRAALAAVTAESAYPMMNVMPSFGYLFSDEKMKAWDRVTGTVAFDSASATPFPTKVMKAGEIALEEARAAGERFRGRKFALQRRVLSMWFEIAAMDEMIRLERSDVALARVFLDTAAARVAAGGPQADLSRAEIDTRLAEDRLAALLARRRAAEAGLNGMLARPPWGVISTGVGLFAPRPLAVDDAALLRAGVAANPELAALARESAGREAALDLARQQFIPDVAPMFSFTGSIERMVGAMVSVPTNVPAIAARVREAEAALEAARAMTRQARADSGARYVAALVALRDAERQRALLEETVIPAAARAAANAEAGYVTSQVMYRDLIDARRMELDVRRMAVEARLAREQRLAEVEELAGVDAEAVGGEAGSREVSAGGEHVGR